MVARKPCERDGCDEPKARGNAKWCIEDWLSQQPMQVQIRYARERLQMIPEELRISRVPQEQWPEGRRWCSGCQSFVRLIDCSGSRCKACNAAASREYALETKYSLSKEEYDRLFKASGGRCYLCGRKSPSRPLAPDHDHVTGEVRGLLCPDPEWGCNLKIVARADAFPEGALAFAIKMVQYFRDPPARQILQR